MEQGAPCNILYIFCAVFFYINLEDITIDGPRAVTVKVPTLTLLMTVKKMLQICTFVYWGWLKRGSDGVCKCVSSYLLVHRLQSPEQGQTERATSLPCAGR